MHCEVLSNKNVSFVFDKNLLYQVVGTLLVCVPLREVHLNPEALPEVAEHLAAGGAALLHDDTQHLGGTALVEGIVLAALDQLLVDLEVCEVHQGLEDTTERVCLINKSYNTINMRLCLLYF